MRGVIEFYQDIEKAKYWIKRYEDTRYDIHDILDELKGLEYSAVEEIITMKADTDENPYIRGVFIRDEYVSKYPNTSLASDVLGFSTVDLGGATGLELYYNQYLSGEDGREYGYVNDDNVYQTIIREAQDGNNIVTTIDYNVQSIVEKKIAEYKAEYLPKNIGVIIADPNTGEIIAMASDKTYDLNNPRDLTEYYTAEEIAAMNDTATVEALNGIWSNFCITNTYEPGSTFKPFTIAAAIEEANASGENTYLCDGFEVVGGWNISCNKHTGHGLITLKQALTFSCYDALMQIAAAEGKDTFVKYQSVFGFGKSSGIDLPSEESAEGLLYDETMNDTDLATKSFGQNFNVTMIQMVAGFSSIINGGNYYKPHLVKQIVDSDGAVVENVEKTLVKKTVSKETSDFIKDSLLSVVTEGTGKAAAVTGYQVAGKTGTAEKLDKNSQTYLLSFLGFAPYENPELVCYVVVDEVGNGEAGNSAISARLFSEIMTEVLPYMGVYPEG
ncbi:MAG: peptidoglycan glycosyltransferase [Clostridiales bacterium]|nr:peptidoglycan glycosyltransferase [Clostridiales bacterium]